MRVRKKSERRKLIQLIRRYLLEVLGGVLLEEGETSDGHVAPEILVDTHLGKLWVKPYGVGIFCRWQDVERAKSVLPHGPNDALNPYSGKWNFYFSGPWTAASAFALFQADLRKALTFKKENGYGAVFLSR